MYIQGTTLEQISSFPYLGSVITENVRCEKEIRTTLNKALGISTSLSRTWKSQNISVRTKVRLLRTLVWPVATCIRVKVLPQERQMKRMSLSELLK